ncbi:MAG: FkbM family methyltransferase [Candidatus Nezhaarchaeota archaeon]|nr:FkbM family methyltransferase [Candidatus Nezhaarchaeota archaeon]
MLEVEGIKFTIRTGNPYDIIEGALLPYYHEPREYEWFSSIVKKGSFFVDIGAYIGGYSVRACKIGAKVVAVEPDKENFKLLVRNLKLNSCNAYAFNVAAGSRKEVAPIYAVPEDSTDRYSLSGRGKKFITDRVEVLPMDEILSMFKEAYSKIDLVKIDVEGFEYEVLSGMKNFLEKIQYLMIEVTPETMKPCLNTLRKNFKVIYMCKHAGEGIIYYNVFLKRK